MNTDSNGIDDRFSSAVSAVLNSADLTALLIELAHNAEDSAGVLLTDDPYLGLATDGVSGIGLWDLTSERLAREPSTRDGRLAHRDWECRWRRLPDGNYRVVFIVDATVVTEPIAARLRADPSAVFRHDLRPTDAAGHRILLGEREGDGCFREGRIPYELPYSTRQAPRSRRLALQVREYEAAHPDRDDPEGSIAFARFAGLAGA